MGKSRLPGKNGFWDFRMEMVRELGTEEAGKMSEDEKTKWAGSMWEDTGIKVKQRYHEIARQKRELVNRLKPKQVPRRPTPEERAAQSRRDKEKAANLAKKAGFERYKMYMRSNRTQADLELYDPPDEYMYPTDCGEVCNHIDGYHEFEKKIYEQDMVEEANACKIKRK